MSEKQTISRVQFTCYRALSKFQITLSDMNILVGPNNSGKSTIISAFRILAYAIRIARARNAVAINGPDGRRPGWSLSEDALPTAAENIHSDYVDEDSTIQFTTSGNGQLTLYFPASGGCVFFADHDKTFVGTPREFKRFFHLDIQVVPVLGPLEHREQIVSRETIDKNLSTTRASRNFRSYWLLNPGGFGEFASTISRTWPGMEVQKPELSGDCVVMFCLENRISRELYWAGFGFQIWLQLITHLNRVANASIIVVDEPEIYLHPDVQRQLLGILRDCGADVLLATHSTEIMTEADPTEILIVDKTKVHAKRLKTVEGQQGALSAIGSIQNIALSRLARNGRLLFVEGDSDFRILRRFAKAFGLTELAGGGDLTAIGSGGFSSWKEVLSLAKGIERALGVPLGIAAVYDRDYHCDEEIESVVEQLKEVVSLAHIHSRKEMENYLLVPAVVERLALKLVGERDGKGRRRTSKPVNIEGVLERVTAEYRAEVHSQYIAKRVDYLKASAGRRDTATITKEVTKKFDEQWQVLSTRMGMVPGKLVLSNLRDELASEHGITITDARIVSEFRPADIPPDLAELLRSLETFRRTTTVARK